MSGYDDEAKQLLDPADSKDPSILLQSNSINRPE